MAHDGSAHHFIAEPTIRSAISLQRHLRASCTCGHSSLHNPDKLCLPRTATLSVASTLLVCKVCHRQGRTGSISLALE